MTTPKIKVQFKRSIILGLASVAMSLSVSCSTAQLGPLCAEYYGESGCCLKAAAGNPVAVDACHEQAAQAASAQSRDQAEAACMQAQIVAENAGLCGPGSDMPKGTSSECNRYLACAAKVAPTEFPKILESYGPASVCWTSPALGPTCTSACLASLESERMANPTVSECASCETSKDCWSALPFCDSMIKTCVTCLKDEDCSSSLCNDRKCMPGCRIGSAYFAPGVANPSNACQSCQPDKSKSAWTDSTEGSSCGAGSVCANSTCKAGCYIDGAFRSPGSVDSGSGCRKCDPAITTSDWSGLSDGTSCGGGMTCLGGYCGGPKFTAQTSGTTTDLFSVWGRGKTAFVVGADGTILRTTNGGNTWTKQVSGTSTILNSVWGSDANDVYAVGDDGSMLHTTDGGVNWSRKTLSGSPRGTCLWGSAKNDVYVVGFAGVIFRSVDSGTTWSRVSGSASGDFQSIWGSAANDIYVVGNAGVIYRSTTGTSWTKQTSGTTGNLYGVFGSAKNDVLAAGATGMILATTDSGATWSKKTSGTTGTLWVGWARSSKDRFVVGTPNLLLFNTGAAAWTPVTSGTTADLFSISGGGADVYIVGAAGTVLHSQ